MSSAKSRSAPLEGWKAGGSAAALSPRLLALSKSWPAAEREWLAAFVETLREKYSPIVRKAVLYGSKARGDWHAESDIDVLVVVQRQPATRNWRLSASATT